MDKKLSCAEVLDVMNCRIAIGLLLASLAYGLDAAVYLLADADIQILKWLSFSISMLSVLLIFRAAVPVLWKKINSRSLTHEEPESFITASFHKAMIKSWTVTIAALMFFKVFEQFIVRIDLPIEFYLNGLVFVMLFYASVSFLLLTHDSEGDGHHEALVK